MKPPQVRSTQFFSPLKNWDSRSPENNGTTWHVRTLRPREEGLGLVVLTLKCHRPGADMAYTVHATVTRASDIEVEWFVFGAECSAGGGLNFSEPSPPRLPRQKPYHKHLRTISAVLAKTNTSPEAPANICEPSPPRLLRQKPCEPSPRVAN